MTTDADEQLVLIAFGRVVRGMREAAGVTQTGLAEAAGVSRRTITSLESGEANPSLLKMMRIAVALDLPISTFTAHLVALLNELPMPARQG